MLFAFGLLCCAAGHFCSGALWARGPGDAKGGGLLGPWQVAASTSLCALGAAVGLNWALSAVGGLTAWGLLGGALVLAIASGFAANRLGVPLRPVWPPRGDPPASQRALKVAAVVATLPLLLWVAFVLWRGELMPALHHDALSYHLPKALMLVRNHGFGFFDVPDSRIPAMPFDYELLLADVIALDGNDHRTEWVGTVSYVAFLLATGAMAERWWGRGWHVLATVLLAGGMPLVLLHSGAHKNDLLANAFFLQVFLWAGVWNARGNFPSVVLTLSATALGAGTKAHGLLVAAVVGMLVLAQSARRRGFGDFRHALLLVLATVGAAFFLFGGFSYLTSVLHHSELVGTFALSGPEPSYGQWANLFWYPPLVLLAPFNSSSTGVWVPWLGELWYWPRYELYASNFGALVTAAVLALPALVFFARRKGLLNSGPGAQRLERNWAAAAAVLTVLAILPIWGRPFGQFSTYSRYLTFVASIALAWAVPLAARLAPAVRPWVAATCFVGIGVCFSLEAVANGMRDRFVPWRAVVAALEDPKLRRTIPFDPARAGSVVDRLAGPNDVVAVDASFDTWVYPIYGEGLTREVRFIAPGLGPPVIPDEAKWVVVDRSFNKVWRHPQFENMGQTGQYLGNGPLRPEDERVRIFLEHDPRFERVYDRPQNNNWVFKRRN